MMDSRGSITIELAVILVLIILIMGAVLSAYQNTADKIIRTQESQNFQTMADNVVDTLINDPGTPQNWHEIGKGTPGLAIVNEEGQVIPNSVSWVKFCVLGENYKKLISKKIFNSNMKTSMELIPQKSSISSVKIGLDGEADNVYSVNRLVKCDFYKSHVIKDFQSPGKCNRNHDQDKCSCNYFKVFRGNLKSSDYYLLIDGGQKYKLKYMVDTTRVVKDRAFMTSTSDKIYLNDEISFYDDDSAVVFVHFDKPHAKALLVRVPRDFDRDRLTYDYFRTNDCQFVLKAWY